MQSSICQVSFNVTDKSFEYICREMTFDRICLLELVCVVINNNHYLAWISMSESEYWNFTLCDSADVTSSNLQQ